MTELFKLMYEGLGFIRSIDGMDEKTGFYATIYVFDEDVPSAAYAGLVPLRAGLATRGLRPRRLCGLMGAVVLRNVGIVDVDARPDRTEQFYGATTYSWDHSAAIRAFATIGCLRLVRSKRLFEIPA